MSAPAQESNLANVGLDPLNLGGPASQSMGLNNPTVSDRLSGNLLGSAFSAQVEAQRMLRQNQFGIRLRICCETLLFLGCIHLGMFPDWWNGITDIGIAILLSTCLFQRASISTLVSVILLSFLNFIVQLIAFLSLLKIEIFESHDAPHQFLFITYMILIFLDLLVMFVTGNASAMLLKDVLQIMLRQEESDLETPLLGNESLSPGSTRGGGSSQRGDLSARDNRTANPPFSGIAYKLDVSDDVPKLGKEITSS